MKTLSSILSKSSGGHGNRRSTDHGGEQKTSKHVLVLMGGWSSEREVSLKTGAAVAESLKRLGHKVDTLDINRNIEHLVTALKHKPDVVFNALHGHGGEDGCIQGVLDFVQVPYTYSRLLTSAVAMDKNLTKLILSNLGIRTPKGFLATKQDVLSRHLLPLPYVVKPNDEGSSVGVHIIDLGNSLSEKDWLYGDMALVEEYIKGRELTVGVLSSQDSPAKALAVTEVLANDREFYDYVGKYTEGSSIHIVPADIPPEVAEEVKRMAELAHTALGCNGASRSDFRYDDSKSGTDGLYFLEINTQAGLTRLSLIPEQAQLCGMSFDDLVQWILDSAMCHG